MSQIDYAKKISAIIEKWGFDPPRMGEKNDAAFVKVMEFMEWADSVAEASKEFVIDREEATENIWYVSGKKGRALFSALRIPYVAKD